ncbi:MAG: GspH/FimT family pseudopilin [Burkholderiaceae bacterium]|nr:GspH/FimT family pseudopilin [Burkholderiaceae bacterium]
MPTAPTRRQSGFSLVEALIPLTVAGVLLGSALPSLDTMKHRRQLEGSAAQLETDLQLARSAAVAANSVLRMDFVAAGGHSCYVLHDGPAHSCDCGIDGVPVCEAGVTAWRSAHFGVDHPVQLRANVSSVGFDPVKGTVTPTASIRLDSPVGQLRVVVNVMGRVRSCTPDVSLPGQVAC